VARGSSGFVAALTAAALATVGFLAYRASATAPADLGRSRVSSAVAGVAESAGGRRKAVALPAGSGTDERVVYSLGTDRVWLVSAGDRVNRTYKVTPGSVDPPLGTYWVSSRSNSVTGTDGIPVEHVVRFTIVSGVTVGFSAAVTGTSSKPDPTIPTGGIRQKRPDGNAMWDFARIGQKVSVVR
jgi:hypothetical protein